MSDSHDISRVHSYQKYRFCAIRTQGGCRYMVACPEGILVVREGFSTVLEAIRDAQRQAILRSINASK